jgi:ATP-dependent helicase/nuclease subunit A
MVSVDVPVADRPRLNIPTPEQMHTLIEAAKGSPWEIPILLLVVTGARRSEVIGLSWDNVDFENGVVRIVQGFHWTKQDGFHFLKPKSKKSKREIVLPGFAVETLRRWKTSQVASIHRLVCLDDEGQPIRPYPLSEAFRRLAVKAGFSPKTRLHDLRHGVVALLALQGVHPKVVSEMMAIRPPGSRLMSRASCSPA